MVPPRLSFIPPVGVPLGKWRFFEPWNRDGASRLLRRNLLMVTLLGASLPLSTPAARGHGDDQLIINALSEELALKPEADLFIRRGELFRHHEQWAKAEADFVAAARLEPELKVIDYFRARLLLEAGTPATARPFVERYVAGVPDEPEGWFLQGEVRAALGQSQPGAESYADGIRRAPRPRPEHYIRRAQLLAAAPSATHQAVLGALDEGIARLGPVISLVDYAISLELEAKNYRGALARIAVAMEHAPRREAWLVRQGDILVKSGQPKEAAAAYRAALAAIEELPDRYRATVPVEKLERDARASLDRLAMNHSSPDKTN